MKKRIISLILVLALCLSLLPTVFAADNTTMLDGTKGIVIDENTADKTVWSDGIVRADGKTGTATWDRVHNFLTLDNYNVETDGTPALTTSCFLI